MAVALQMLRRMQELGEIINMYGWVRLLTCITWAKKWFSSHVNWLEVVVDSAIGG